MSKSDELKEMEDLFGALADGTRLRLLNLMRKEEICVCFLTEVLEVSQPKISRHLAYLRNAGLVNARRDGKWVHYSINWPKSAAARAVLEATLEWLAENTEIQKEKTRLREVCCTPELLAQIARSPIENIPVPLAEGAVARRKKTEKGYAEVLPEQPEQDLKAGENELYQEELEEFLL